MRLRLLAIGIGNYRTPKPGIVAAAPNDARHLYEALSSVTGGELDHCSSGVLPDCTSGDALSAIRTFARGAIREDINIIYFSGHGLIQRDHLTLLFSDFSGDQGGCIGIIEIGALITSNSNGEFILILDCCHAGAAKSIVTSPSVYFNGTISILGAADATSGAPQGDKGSPFTNALVGAILALGCSGDTISVTSIHEKMIDSGYTDSFVALAEGKTDFILRNGKVFDDEFSNLFYSALLRANAGERAALWYMLADKPEKQVLSVLRDSRLLEEKEPIWLGRRAIGSCIDKVRTDRNTKADICEKLITAPSLALQCIGLIGARHELDNANILERFYTILRSHGDMDARWLALLAISDQSLFTTKHFNELLDSSFGQSEWGKTELFKAMLASGKPIEISNAIRTILSANAPPSLRLSIEVACRWSATFKNADWPHEHSQILPKIEERDKDVRRMLSLNVRRRTNVSGSEKWFLSQLHGNYRWQLQYNLAGILRDGGAHTEMHIAECVLEIGYAPLILSFLESCRRQRTEDFKVEPFLQHSHPWIRREAIQISLHHDGDAALEKIIKSALTYVDEEIYPGKIDFLTVVYGALSFYRRDSEWAEIVKLQNVRDGDLRSMSAARNKELIFSTI